MAMNNESRARWHVSPQIIIGLAIVFFGLVLTAENLGVARNLTRIIHFWPLVFTAAGLAMVLDREATGGRKMWGSVLIIAGVWQTAVSAFGLNLYLDDWWPLLLIGLGGLLIYRAIQRPGAVEDSRPAASAGGPEDSVNSFAFMSGVKRNIFSSSFRRAQLTAIMGGVEFDLRQCTATGGESVIDVFAIWGGIGIRVPADWQVVSEVTPLMGGVDDRSGHVQPFRHRLVIKGAVLMGGVEVKS
jgi:hypothetical protein